jgi:hypothetical protein
MEEYGMSAWKYQLKRLKLRTTTIEALYEAETQVGKALKAARDNAAAVEHAFYQLILRAKKQVLAQFGESSNANLNQLFFFKIFSHYLHLLKKAVPLPPIFKSNF